MTSMQLSQKRDVPSGELFRNGWLIVGCFKSSHNYLVYSGREQVQQIIIILKLQEVIGSICPQSIVVL
jgi:hypothetical protein